MNAEASGGDFYDDAVTARYLAHRHSGASSPNIVMEEPAVLAHLGDLSGLRVIDLGCGDGAFADVVLDAGARSYLGRDGSAAMIDLARNRVPRTRARFQLGTIEDFRPPPESADLVTSRMAFHYLRDVFPTLCSIHQALSPAGQLIFTVTHPVITSHDNHVSGPRTTWTVDHYFETGERRRSWFGTEVTWFHRTVEQYLSAVLAAGFDLEAISECEPDPRQLARAPEELARRRRVPLVLLVSARRR
jgi:SAM-dependent methyltransferase